VSKDLHLTYFFEQMFRIKSIIESCTPVVVRTTIKVTNKMSLLFIRQINNKKCGDYFFLSFTHNHTHTHSLSLSLSHTHTYTQAHINTHTISLSHTHTHTSTHTHTQTHTHGLPSGSNLQCFSLHYIMFLKSFSLSLSLLHTHTHSYRTTYISRTRENKSRRFFAGKSSKRWKRGSLCARVWAAVNQPFCIAATSTAPKRLKI